MPYSYARLLWGNGRLTAALVAQLLSAAVLVFAVYPSPLSHAADRPNILLILADDFGNNDLAAWGDGQTLTPSLDQLSQESLRFRHHYTDSTCSVSRAALLSAQHPVQIGFEPNGVGLSSDLPTLPRVLQKNGYHTVHVGKWHVGQMYQYPGVWPRQQGFAEWFGMFSHFTLQGPDADGRLTSNKPTFINPWLSVDDQPIKQYAGHLDDLLTDYTVQKIHTLPTHAPWFINLWLLSPHTPHQPSDAFAKQFPDTAEGRYLAVLAQLDHNIKRVLNAVQQSAHADNTLVIFASDNGSPNIARNSNHPFALGKNTYREGGVRTPLMMRWPKHLPAADIQQPTHITDLFPTLIGLANLPVPENLYGRDLSKALLNQQPLPPLERLYWAADSAIGQMYAVHYPNQGLVAKDLQKPLAAEQGLGALPEAKHTAMPTLTPSQAPRSIAQWERQHRPFALTWQRHSASSGVLSGRDYQRVPSVGGFSLALGVGRPQALTGRQTLFAQDKIWSLSLTAQQHLELVFGDVKVLTPKPVALEESCNALVTSVFISPKMKHPFNTPGASEIRLYVNGVEVGKSLQMLEPIEHEALLQAPTYIGQDPDRRAAFTGTLSRPIMMSKHFFQDQDGYSLADLNQDVCSP